MRIPRFWMTGCMALVMLAAHQWSSRPQDEESRPQRRGMLSMHSPFSVDQTVDRLATAARSRGMTLLARVDHLPAHAAFDDAEAATDPDGARLLVFGTADGNTPVLQDDDAGELNLPMKVIVHDDGHGGTTVLFDDPASLPPGGMPGDVASKLTALPQLIDAALA